MKNHIVTCLMNVALVAIFAITAMRFEKWWIILFVYLIIIAANPGETPGKDERQEVRNPRKMMKRRYKQCRAWKQGLR